MAHYLFLNTALLMLEIRDFEIKYKPTRAMQCNPICLTQLLKSYAILHYVQLITLTETFDKNAAIAAFSWKVWVRDISYK